VLRGRGRWRRTHEAALEARGQADGKQIHGTADGQGDPGGGSDDDTKAKEGGNWLEEYLLGGNSQNR
jgi:hypothetical protein